MIIPVTLSKEWNILKEQSPKYYLLILILLLGLIITSASLFKSIYTDQQELINVQENRYDSYLLTTLLRRSSDDLTRLARMYVVTGNPLFEKQFHDVLAIRNGQSPLPANYDRVYWDFMAVNNDSTLFEFEKPVSLISLMISANFTKSELLLLEESQEKSDELVSIEETSFNAINGIFQDDKGEFTISAKPNQQMAIDLLYSDKYHMAKINIMKPINQFYEALDKRTKKQVSNTSTRLDISLNIQIIIFILSVCTIILLIFLSWRYHKNMLKILNQRVIKRTEELQTSNIELKKALKQIKTLEGIITVCAYCHNIRDENKEWNIMEKYLSDHSDARFSHGICPKCVPIIRLESCLDVKQ
jgi:hypothetical protein